MHFVTKTVCNNIMKAVRCINLVVKRFLTTKQNSKKNWFDDLLSVLLGFFKRLDFDSPRKKALKFFSFDPEPKITKVPVRPLLKKKKLNAEFYFSASRSCLQSNVFIKSNPRSFAVLWIFPVNSLKS